MGNSSSSEMPRRSHRDSADSIASKRKRVHNCKVKGDSGSEVPGRSSRTFLGGEIEPRATNPFIIFFLRLRSKKPKERVTVIARLAGKLWKKMPMEQRQMYIDLASSEKKRRDERKRKRKLHRKAMKNTKKSVS